MGGLVKETLRRICVEFGWNYAVFWKGIRCGDQMNLVWEDGHCERTSTVPAASGFEAMDWLIKESGVLRTSQNGRFSQLGCQAEDRIRTLVFKLMATQVHVVGDGMVGKVALTGKHKWMLGDMLTDNGTIPKGLAEINNQLLAGIKTIAIIPVLPFGIVQLGSTRMVIENFGIMNHVRGLFEQLQFVPEVLSSDATQKTSCRKIEPYESVGPQTSIKQFGEACTDIDSSSSFNDDNSNCFIHQDSIAFTKLCTSSTQFYNQMQGNVLKAILAKDNLPRTILPRSTGCLEADLMISNPNVRLVKNELPCESDSQGQCQPSTCLPHSRWTFLEEELLSLSGIRPIEFADNRESIFDSTNLNQLQSYGSTSLNLLQGCETISSSARSQVLNDSNDLGKFNLFSTGVEDIRSQGAISSDCSSFNLTLPGNLEQSHRNSIDRISETAGKLKNSSSLSQALGKQTQVNKCGTSSYSSMNGNPPDGHVQEIKTNQDSTSVENVRGTASLKKDLKRIENPEFLQSSVEKVCVSSLQSASGVDLFDALHIGQHKPTISHGNLDDVKMRSIDAPENSYELSTDFSTCVTGLETGPLCNALDDEIYCNGIFLEAGTDQLLDAVVSQFNPGAKYQVEDNESCKTSLTKVCSTSLHGSSPINGWVASTEKMHAETFGLPPVLLKSEPETSGSVKSSCSMERGEVCFPQENRGSKSQINLWIEGKKMDCDNHYVVLGKKVDEVGKPAKKRARPGESTRPRPKDRQMIQDRVKELREIIPNGAKCSIDALLEKTIKHMLFLQSVTKHADKLKDIGEPKIISDDGGMLLKDNFEGGATWAFEVGSQSTICPIIVEDLNPPRLLLVEVLCEERGLFLEIADLVRGLGLTILKGAMEARNDKVWARFAVEANRDVTRMEIFLSLARLLEPSAASNNTLEGVNNTKHNMFHPPSSIPATGSSDRLW